MSLLIRIERRSTVPLHRQIVAAVRERIEAGSLQAGDRMPPSRRLAVALGLNRTTVVLAYDELRALGYIHSCPGSYTTVARRRAEAPYDPDRFGRMKWGTLCTAGAEAALRAFQEDPPENGGPPGDNAPLDLASIEPDPRLYPLADSARCFRDALNGIGAGMFRYAEAAGYPPLREILARRLRLHGISVSSREILITNGAQQGLDLAVRVLGGRSKTAVVESPTYSCLLPLLRLNGLKAAAVPMTDDGPDLQALDLVLQRTRPSFIYTMPNFHNPTGLTSSHARRERLYDLASRRGVPVLEDGFEEDMKYSGPVPLPIKSIDDLGIVVYVGTFSKTLFPGLRVGWIAADRSLIERLTAVKRFTDLATNMPGQMILERFCRLGLYDRHLQRVRRIYRRRMNAALNAASRYFPEGAAWTKPAGGYIIWVRMPMRTAVLACLNRIRTAGVLVSPGGPYFPNRAPSRYIRLSIARVDEAEIDEAFRRLGKALRPWS